MITIRAKLFSSERQRALGLIPYKKAFPVLFKTRFGIHTFGMKFAIDVIVLDKENRVVKMAQNLKPKNVFFWNPKYNLVLELPAGFIKDKRIKLGSKLSLKMVE